MSTLPMYGDDLYTLYILNYLFDVCNTFLVLLHIPYLPHHFSVLSM
jgi:hypothetical protein